ncbi:MAG: BON domain-containing protein [Methylomicrobium sp.]
MLKQLRLLTLVLAAGLMLMADLVNAAGETAGSRLENTERNVRDKGNTTLTPEDQLENESDIRITAAIRKAITDDDSLSVNAQNVKVITRNGMVTLRGPVDSEAEKTKLQTIVKQVSGVSQVDNQLETKAP